MDSVILVSCVGAAYWGVVKTTREGELPSLILPRNAHWAD